MNAELHIQTAQRNGKTYLKKAYFTQPFKVVDITEDKRAGQLELMLMSSSPGILDGDTYHMRIDVAESCSLNLQTQSYQRLFTMKQGASQHMHVALGPNATFCFLPHPSVPHEGSCFSAKNQIHLASGSTFIWGEVVTCGRKLNGEVFQFSTYHSITEVFLNNRLVVKENLLVQPDRMTMNTIGQLEGFTHQASLLFLNETASPTELSELVHSYLDKQPAIQFGISTLPVNGLVVRILGHRAEQLHTCLKTIAQLLSSSQQRLKPVAYAT